VADHEVHWFLAEHETPHVFHLSGIPLTAAFAIDQAAAEILQPSMAQIYTTNQRYLIYVSGHLKFQFSAIHNNSIFMILILTTSK